MRVVITEGNNKVNWIRQEFKQPGIENLRAHKKSFIILIQKDSINLFSMKIQFLQNLKHIKVKNH